MENYWEPLRTIENSLRTTENCENSEPDNHWELLTENSRRTIDSSENHWELLRTTENCWEPLRTTEQVELENHENSVENSAGELSRTHWEPWITSQNCHVLHGEPWELQWRTEEVLMENLSEFSAENQWRTENTENWVSSEKRLRTEPWTTTENYWAENHWELLRTTEFSLRTTAELTENSMRTDWEPWFSMVFSEFSVVLKPWFSAVLSGSQQFSMVLSGCQMVLRGSQWFSAILSGCQWFEFSVVLSGSQ